ncbi:MAG: site-2 protease family protein [Spirochaetia bacterium]|jgi:membrane-associated protease RseP (regulator of RpoE activity)|nr:site-2 protease family protein [Spirochaetia bacterium]
MKSPKTLIKNYLSELNGGLPGQKIIFSGETPRKESPAVNIILFILTFISCAYMGSRFFSTDAEAAWITGGLPYAAAVLVILLCHEFGHYFAAKAFGIEATYPYFIPFPSMIGTMGAVIKIKSAIPNRRALLYVGAMGPIAGFITGVIVLGVGVYLSDIRTLPSGSMVVFGDSLLIKIMIKIFHGYIPWGHDLVLSPLAAAGWVGCLVTGLNLMPIGLLDGGHILYAIAGKRQRIAGWLAFAAVILMCFHFQGWIIWVVLILSILKIGHPHVEDAPAGLSFSEKIMGWLFMLILILTFIPVPLSII